MININKVIIRDYNDKDAEELSTFMSKDVKDIYTKYYEGDICNDLLINTSPENIIKRSKEEGKKTFVAEIDGKVVGIIGLSGKNQLRTFHVKDKKQGIGTKLFKHIKNIAIKNGEEEIIVKSLMSSPHIYEKIGFIKIKNDFDYSSISGVKYEVVILKYNLKK